MKQAASIALRVGLILKVTFLFFFLLPLSSMFAQDISGQQIIEALNNAVVEVADKANPSVVTVFTEQTLRTQQVNPFAPFFGFDFEPQTKEYTRKGLGSGVIVSNDGYILTNNHVVGDADRIFVKLFDDDTLSAKVVGTDPNTDVAVIKIKRSSLTALPFGNSDQLRVGEFVLAIGSPLDASLDHTVTMGIVSAKGRSNMNLARIEDFIQTDAAINPGNSGGALINLKGELIGINTAIASRSGGNQGIGFAIPINMARIVMESLIKNGRVVRSFLGVGGLDNVDERYAQALGMEKARGIIVGQVLAGTAAEKAGLKSGDVILELNGTDVNDVRQFQSDIYATRPGTDVFLRIWRDGKTRTIKATLGELDEAQPLASENRLELNIKTGLEFANINAELRERFDLDSNTSGVVITEVDRNSSAFQEGFRPGDVVLSINRRAIQSVGDIQTQLENVRKGEFVLFRLQRGNNAFFRTLRLN